MHFFFFVFAQCNFDLNKFIKIYFIVVFGKNCIADKTNTQQLCTFGE